MILKTLTGLVLVTPHLRLIRDQVPKRHAYETLKRHEVLSCPTCSDQRCYLVN